MANTVTFRREKQGTVYFLGCEHLDVVKIGFTTGNIYNRLNAIQCWCPFELVIIAAIPGSTIDEYNLHTQFKSNRRYGEWFDLTPELHSTIESLQLDGGFNHG